MMMMMMMGEVIIGERFEDLADSHHHGQFMVVNSSLQSVWLHRRVDLNLDG